MPEKAWWRGILIKRKKQKTEQIPSLINHLNFLFIFFFWWGEGGEGEWHKTVIQSSSLSIYTQYK